MSYFKLISAFSRALFTRRHLQVDFVIQSQVDSSGHISSHVAFTQTTCDWILPPLLQMLYMLDFGLTAPEKSRSHVWWDKIFIVVFGSVANKLIHVSMHTCKFYLYCEKLWLLLHRKNMRVCVHIVAHPIL